MFLGVGVLCDVLRWKGWGWEDQQLMSRCREGFTRYEFFYFSVLLKKKKQSVTFSFCLGNKTKRHPAHVIVIQHFNVRGAVWSGLNSNLRSLGLENESVPLHPSSLLFSLGVCPSLYERIACAERTRSVRLVHVACPGPARPRGTDGRTDGRTQ